MNRHRLSLMPRAMGAVVTVTMLTMGTTVVWAQASPAAAGASQAQRPGAVDENQAAAMMAERQKMMANMRAMDQKLNDLVTKMTSARGNDKVETIATLVKEMVAQRTQMHDQMTAMQGRMMSHMTEHMMSMQGGMMGMMNNRGQAGAMPSMSNCPMMKELSKEAAEADHSEHHPEK